MKKLAFIAAAMLVAVVSMGQSMKFNETTHDFGKINEADGRVTTIFTFVNDGDAPLVLSNVRASCGCTTPKWTHEPIEPGKTGEITVTYNPAGRPGRFQKTVTVTSNATEPSMKLYIKGEVIPKQPKEVNPYPVKMGELGLKRRSLSFGSVVQGTNKTMEVEYINSSEQTITLDVLTRPEDAHYHIELTATELAPKATGIMRITLHSAESLLLGPINTKVYMVINGKREVSDTYGFGLNANIREDFSGLTVEQRQKAPIAEIEQEINLGTVQLGKKASFKIPVGNVGGGDVLHIRRIVLDDKMLRLTAPKSPIKNGRRADIKAEIDATNTQLDCTSYSRIVTLITNDPNKPVINFKVNWIIK